MNYHGRKVDAERVIGWIKTLAKGGWIHDAVDAWRDKRVCGISLTRPEAEWEGYKQGKGYYPSQPTKHCILKKAFAGLEIKPNEKLLDMGCGKGRVFAFIIRNKLMPLENVFGIDINPDVLEINRSWTKNYQHITVEQANGLEYDYSPFDIIFISQPIFKNFFLNLVEQFEKTAKKKFKLIYVFDDYSGFMLKERKGWKQIKREKFYRIHGLPVYHCPLHYSHWTFDPNEISQKN